MLTFQMGQVRKIGVLVNERVLDLNQAFSAHLGETFTEFALPADLDLLSLLDLGEEGIREAEKVVEAASKIISGGGLKKLEERGLLLRVDEIRFNAPIPRPRKNIVCLGLNYADHVAEAGRTRGEQRLLPEYPMFFTKPPSAVTGPYDDIVYPRATERLDYEVELALVIGKTGKYIPEGEVYDHIAGYTVFNDVSARDLQRRHGQWFKGKSCDTFAPIGPYLVTPDEIGDPMDLELGLKVNGEARQRSNTGNMIFDIRRIVSTLSSGMTLEVGDIIATGTPSGVGSAHPLGLLKIGDVVETWIEKIGSLQNRVVSEK